MALRLSEAEVTSKLLTQLVEWLDCEYFWGGPKKVLVVTDDEEGFRIRIYTSKHVYAISASENAYPDGSGYLGCTVADRMARPGERWGKGNDLPDGRFSKETLNRILCAIVFYEAREVVKNSKQWDCAEERQSKD